MKKGGKNGGEVENLISEVTKCANKIYNELGEGWSEEIYQKAMEVALREKGIRYEAQRALPVTFNNHVIGESYPDLIVWSKEQTAIVFELKATSDIKEENKNQVINYIKELKKELKKGQKVYKKGFIIDFTKTSGNIKEEKIKKDKSGVKFLEVEYSDK